MNLHSTLRAAPARQRWGRTLGLAIAVAVSAVMAGVMCHELLARERRLTLVLEMDVSIPAPSLGHVFWDARRGTEGVEGDAFNMTDMQPFDVAPGAREYRIPIPPAPRALRLDPVSGPGGIAFRRIQLLSHGWPLREWDAAHGFAGWRAESDLSGVGVAEGALRMQAVGPDPYLVIRGLAGLRAERRRLQLLLAVAAGLIWLAVQSVLVLPAMRASARVQPGAAGHASADEEPPPPPASGSGTRTAPPATGRATALLAVASVLLSAIAGFALYRAFLARRGPPPAPLAADPAYEPTLVDRSGRPLSAKAGGLKVVVDPFTWYRNFPGQRTAHFNIDANGWRGGLDEGAARPRAVVLGGSAAFGLGLDGDADTLAAHLEALDPGYEVVNAGVVGFLSGQELAEMTHYADRVQPRLYVVFDGWNELLQILDFKEAGAPGSLGYNRHIFRTVEDRLRQHAAEELPAGIPADVRAPGWSRDEARRRVTGEYLDNLARMAAFARARNAGLLVVFQPQLGSKRRHGGGEAAAWDLWRSTYGKAYPEFEEDYGALVAAAAAACAERGIVCRDAGQARAIVEDERPLFIDAVHLNAEGYRVLAGLVAGWIGEVTARTSPGSR